MAEDVRYYGEWMKTQAFRQIGHLYPKVKVPKEQGGGEATVIAWIWARTVKCPNPACGCEMPLVRSLCFPRKRKEAWIEPIFENGKRFIKCIRRESRLLRALSIVKALHVLVVVHLSNFDIFETKAKQAA